VTIDGHLNSINVFLEPFGTLYVPNFLMQLFITATSFDGHYINIGVSLASFRTVCFNIFSIPLVKLFASTVSDTEMSVDGHFIQPLMTVIMALLPCRCHCIMLFCCVSFLHEFLFVVFRF